MHRALIPLIALFLSTGLFASSVEPAYGVDGEEALVLLARDTDWKSWRDDFESRGGSITVGFPPDAFFVRGPADLIGALSTPGVIVYTEAVPSGEPSDASAVTRLAAAVWNRRLLAPSAPIQEIPPHLTEPDALDPPTPRLKGAEENSLLDAPSGAGFYDTSEFLSGSVAVGLFLPESDGTIDQNRENWTTTEITEVVTGVQGALSFLASLDAKADVSFYLVVYDSMLTGYEPIKHGTYTSGEQALWITDCMDSVGFTTGDIFYRTRAFNNALRDTLDTDWGTTMFVVDSSHDVDGRFQDQTYAYSYIGGPFLVMTYDNWNWGIQNMDAIASHETLHQFYALDEYLGTPCTEASGYLGAENQNSQAACSLDVLCLMRTDVDLAFDADSVCWYTRGQVGWWDSDGDSILDIFDTNPETTLDAFPDTAASQTPTFTGAANVTLLTNLNPRGQGNEITTTTIVLVECRIDGGAWLPASPLDGAWDEVSETFTITTGTLPAGQHRIDARAVSSVGNLDASPASDVFIVVDVTAPAPLEDFMAAALDTTVELSWVLPPTPDCVGVRIRYRTDAYPSGPEDGVLLGDFSGDPGAADTTVHSGVSPDTTYYYAAFARDAVPNFSSASNALGTPLDPAPPGMLVAPADGSSYAPLAPVFLWSQSIPEAGDTIIAYWISLADNPAFTSPLVDEEVTTGAPPDTSWPLADSLARGTSYFVRLRAKDASSGTYGFFSAPFSFTTRLPVDSVAWRPAPLSEWSSFAAGDTLPAGADARIEVAFRPADSAGVGGHAGRVVYTRDGGASWDSLALAWHHASGDTGFFRATLAIGVHFQHYETVSFRVEGWDPPSIGAPLIDDGGYSFVAGANPVGSFHVPTRVGFDSETMRDPLVGNYTTTQYAFQVAAPAGKMLGATLRLKSASGPTFESFQGAFIGSLTGEDYFRVTIDTVFATEDSLVYYFLTWGDAFVDTTYLGGTNDTSITYLVEASAIAAPFGFRVGTVTAVDPWVSSRALGTSLFQNMPNPFNPHTVIPFELNAAGPQHVRLVVYDASGRVVRLLVNTALPPGPHEAAWDGITDAGTPAGSGLYFYELRTESARELRRMTLLR